MTDRVSELKLFFSTPVWVSRVKNHEEVNKKILEYIKSLESQNPKGCLLYTSPSPRDKRQSRMPSSA